MLLFIGQEAVPPAEAEGAESPSFLGRARATRLERCHVPMSDGIGL